MSINPMTPSWVYTNFWQITKFDPSPSHHSHQISLRETSGSCRDSKWGQKVIVLRPWRTRDRTPQHVSEESQKTTSRGVSSSRRTVAAIAYAQKSNNSRMTGSGLLFCISLLLKFMFEFRDIFSSYVHTGMHIYIYIRITNLALKESKDSSLLI